MPLLWRFTDADIPATSFLSVLDDLPDFKSMGLSLIALPDLAPPGTKECLAFTEDTAEYESLDFDLSAVVLSLDVLTVDDITKFDFALKSDTDVAGASSVQRLSTELSRAQYMLLWVPSPTAAVFVTLTLAMTSCDVTRFSSDDVVPFVTAVVSCARPLCKEDDVERELCLASLVKQAGVSVVTTPLVLSLEELVEDNRRPRDDLLLTSESDDDGLVRLIPDDDIDDVLDRKGEVFEFTVVICAEEDALVDDAMFDEDEVERADEDDLARSLSDSPGKVSSYFLGTLGVCFLHKLDVGTVLFPAVVPAFVRLLIDVEPARLVWPTTAPMSVLPQLLSTPTGEKTSASLAVSFVGESIFSFSGEDNGDGSLRALSAAVGLKHLGVIKDAAFRGSTFFFAKVGTAAA